MTQTNKSNEEHDIAAELVQSKIALREAEAQLRAVRGLAKGSEANDPKALDRDVLSRTEEAEQKNVLLGELQTQLDDMKRQYAMLEAESTRIRQAYDGLLDQEAQCDELKRELAQLQNDSQAQISELKAKLLDQDLVENRRYLVDKEVERLTIHLDLLKELLLREEVY